MTRTPFFLCVASLFTSSAVSFMVINNEAPSTLRHTSAVSSTKSVLHYANADVVDDQQKLESFRNSIFNTFKRFDEDNNKDDEGSSSVLSASELMTQQLVREFTSARRYLLAAGAVKGLSEYFYAEEEQQRVKAMELIEFARAKGIELSSDYSDMISKTPINKKLPTAEFVQELIRQDQQDLKFLDVAMSQVSKTDTDLVNFFEAIKLGYVDRHQEFLGLLSKNMPSLDIPTSMGGIVLDQATAAVAVDATTTSTTTATATSSAADTIVSRGWNLPSSIPKSDDLVGEVGGALPDPHMVVAATTGATIGVAAVDTDALPSTEDILDALPIDTDEIVEMVTIALPSTEDILDALPIAITPDDIQQAVDSIDTIQQSLMDAETLSQIVDIVSGLY